MLCDDLNVKEIQKRADICICMGFPGGSACEESPAMQETPVQFLGWEVPLERNRLPTPVFLPGKFHDRGD